MRPRTNEPITRRELIAASAFVPLSSLTLTAQSAPTLTAEHLRILTAFVDRLIPSDELGPGALEAGVAEYIDRALGGAYANRKPAVLEGLRALDSYARGSHGGAFADLAPAMRDAAVQAVENDEAFPGSRAFFVGIRSLTMEGMFGDPWYGGNRNFIGWDLIRYPGPRLAVSAEDQALKVAPAPYRRSARGASGAR